MSTYEMEAEDFLRAKDAEIGSLREELQRLRLDNEAKERESEMLLAESLRLKRDLQEARKQLQAWADEADAEIQLAKLRRAELEAMEL